MDESIALWRRNMLHVIKAVNYSKLLNNENCRNLERSLFSGAENKTITPERETKHKVDLKN